MNVPSPAEWLLFIANTFILLWGFQPIQAARPASGKRIALAYALLVFLRLPLYFLIDFIAVPWVNSALRLAPGIVFLYIRKQISWKRCIYYSCLIWIGFTACINILMAPFLSRLLYAPSQLPGTAVADYWISQGIKYVFSFLMITLLTRNIPLNEIQTVGRERLAMMAFVIFCELYIAQTLYYLQADQGAALTVYLVLLQAFVICALLLFEKYLHSQAEARQMQMMELTKRYRYEALQTQQAAEMDIRHVHHDMKNHLLTIRRLADRPAEMERYIGGLLEEFSDYETLVNTGNTLLDGLITDKIAKAGEKGILFQVQLDFRPCAYVEDIDVCTIFGNALDNAIEACAKVEGERQISLIGSRAAGQVVVSCGNTYVGERRLINGLLLSSKGESGHGLGLLSIKRTLERYGGTMVIDMDEPHWFMLRLLFPETPERPLTTTEKNRVPE